jgi:hypothetical protein
MMMRTFVGLGFLSVLSLQSALAAVTPPVLTWEKVKESDGISVYRREVPGADVLAFRGVGVIDASPALIASIIIDTGRAAEWVEDLESASIIRWLAPDRYVEYDHIGTPFVMKDRDFVSVVELSYDRAKRQFVIHYKSTDDTGAPKTSYVRGDLQDTTFVLTEVEGGKTSLDGSILADPKGSVPKWIVNFFQKDWPIDTLKSLRKQAAKSDVKVDARIAALQK